MSELTDALDRISDHTSVVEFIYQNGHGALMPVIDAAREYANGIEIWWCEYTHLGYVREDVSPGARYGLGDWCRTEDHGSCGWRVLIGIGE